MLVESSNIKSVDYNDSILLVEFLSGSKYEYKNVPASLWEDFQTAESKGRFMNANVKGKYEYVRVN